MAQLNFDASQVDPAQPIEAIPSDKYNVEITKSELKPTKTGNGSYLELEFTVLDGEYRGRKVWDRLCLNHPTPKTVEIARANLSAICHAVGVMKPRDSTELHRLPLSINVKLRKDEGTGNIYNEIKGYSKRESLIPASPQAQAYPQATPAPKPDSSPWS